MEVLLRCTWLDSLCTIPCWRVPQKRPVDRKQRGLSFWRHTSSISGFRQNAHHLEACLGQPSKKQLITSLVGAAKNACVTATRGGLQFWALASSILVFRFEPKNLPTRDKTQSNPDSEA